MKKSLRAEPLRTHQVQPLEIHHPVSQFMSAHRVKIRGIVKAETLWRTGFIRDLTVKCFNPVLCDDVVGNCLINVHSGFRQFL